MPYRSLNADRIEATIETLQKRIDERFPNRGLSKLCQQLLEIAREDRRNLSWVNRPNIWLRTGVAIAMFIGLCGFIWFGVSLSKMTVQSYGTWKTMMYESLVRACVERVRSAGGRELWLNTYGHLAWNRP